MDEVICGIDPGFSGGVAFIFGDGKAEVHDMPIFELDGRREIDVRELYQIVSERSPGLSALERNSARRGQGMGSTWRFAEGSGAARAVLEVISDRVMAPTPAAWKASLGLGSDKLEALQMAREIFPDLAKDRLSRKRDDGRAEALLLAEFARRSVRMEVA